MLTDQLRIYEAPKVRRITTRRRSHLPFDSGDPTPGTYCVAIWDHETQSWEGYRSGVSLMGLRAVIRELENKGWTPVSCLIGRE